ncbi:MAG: T9SS type A sorting domain-containing protein [Bacteroidia bacterium]
MKKNLLLLCLFISHFLTAQTPTWNWARSAQCATLYEHIAHDPSGNLVLAGGFTSPTMDFGGTTITGAGGYDIFVAKYDGSGNFMWAKAFGNYLEELAQDVVADASGNIYVTGYFFSDSLAFGSFMLHKSPASGLTNGFILKLDGSGNVVWVKAISNFDLMTNGIATDGVNVYITGSFDGGSAIYDTVNIPPAGPDYNIFLLKVDPSGAGLWGRSSGSSNGHEANGVCTDVAGNVLITGRYKNSSTFGAYTVSTSDTYAHIYLAKYNSSGTALWAKEYGSAGNNWSRAIKCDGSANVYFTGGFGGSSIAFDSYNLTNVSPPSDDIILAKMDPSGNTLWATSAGGNDYDLGIGLTVDSADNPYICGAFTSNPVAFGGTGLFNHGGSSGSEDGFLAKYESDGTLSWVQSVGGGNPDWCEDVTSTGTNAIFTTGHFTSAFITFGSTTFYNSSGSGNLFVAKISESMASVPANDEKNGFVISPNPASDVFSIAMSDPGPKTVKITDNLGRCILKKQTSLNKEEIQLEGESRGIYFIECSSGDHASRKKLILR